LRIAVAGIGNVGLSLALLLAQRHQVTVLDIEQGVEVTVYEPTLEVTEFSGCRVVNDLPAFKTEADLILANRLTTELSDVMGKVYSRDLYGCDD
jgi:UDPglucose 6-dehydrogenase